MTTWMLGLVLATLLSAGLVAVLPRQDQETVAYASGPIGAASARA